MATKQSDDGRRTNLRVFRGWRVGEVASFELVGLLQPVNDRKAGVTSNDSRVIRKIQVTRRFVYFRLGNGQQYRLDRTVKVPVAALGNAARAQRREGQAMRRAVSGGLPERNRRRH